MRKLIIAFSLVIFGLTGCLKDTPSTDLSHVGTIIEIMYPAGAGFYGVGSGLEFFTGETFPYYPTDVSDTVTYYVNIAGTNTLSQSLAVGVVVSDSSLEDNISTDGITYIPLPDSCFTLLPSSGTIPAGSRIDTFKVVYYPYKFDLTQNYGLPLTVSTPGYTVSGNFGTLYLHTIGNPIGGTYTQVDTAYADSAGTGTPTITNLGAVGLFDPLDALDVEVASGAPGANGGNINYVISFSNTNGVLSGFSVSLDPATIPSGTTITGGPNIVLADPVNKKYVLNFTDSTAGANANFTDSYTWVSNK